MKKINFLAIVLSIVSICCNSQNNKGDSDTIELKTDVEYNTESESADNVLNSSKGSIEFIQGLWLGEKDLNQSVSFP